jgi:hypothetical protein
MSRLLGAGHWLLANRGVERGQRGGAGQHEGEKRRGRLPARRSGCTCHGRRAHTSWREREKGTVAELRKNNALGHSINITIYYLSFNFSHFRGSNI